MTAGTFLLQFAWGSALVVLAAYLYGITAAPAAPPAQGHKVLHELEEAEDESDAPSGEEA